MCAARENKAHARLQAQPIHMCCVSSRRVSSRRVSFRKDEAIAYNQAQNITFEAWSPMKHCPFSNPVLTRIAAKYVQHAHRLRPRVSRDLL